MTCTVYEQQLGYESIFKGKFLILIAPAFHNKLY